MSELSVRLFRKLEIERDGQMLADISGRKVQELLCYLLLHRERPHHREILASLLWANSSTAQSKRYLRQALWRLQAQLGSEDEPICGRMFLVQPEWVHLNPAADLWLDVAQFEEAFARVKGVPGQTLDTLRVEALCRALDLYRGDLLEGWFQDWCLYERERLRHMYLAILDKLVDYCEVQGEYEAGLAYGNRILSSDEARERTHRRLMRLHYLSGDRTAALRQFDCCVKALHRELAVEPSARTVALCEQIREDQPPSSTQLSAASIGPPTSDASRWSDVLYHLKRLQKTLAETQGQLQEVIQAMQLSTKDQ
jgi:DNA-binding SARP family transcriptional activator